jgi:hypothetical protein
MARLSHLFLLIAGLSIATGPASSAAAEPSLSPHKTPVPPIFPLREVQPGIVAVARTVFAGEEIEEFELDILGVYEDFAGPDQDVILARLRGDKLQHTGVAAGMSGSPVYADGRLMGALSYRVGSFAKEPLAGITPIEKMLPLLSLPAEKPPASRQAVADPLRWQLPLLPEDDVAVVEFLPAKLSTSGARGAAGGAPPGWAADSPWRGFGIEFGSLAGIGQLPSARGSAWGAGGGLPLEGVSQLASLTPIDTPVSVSGVDPAVLGAYAGALRGLGLLPVQAGSAGRLPAGASRPTRFEPGSAIAAQLARGDVEISGTGTLTYLHDGAVLAFGHPFLRTGPTHLPFAPARILMTVPSLDSSFKLAAPGESLGVLRQDRLTAIAGRVGEQADMIPVRLSVRAAGAAPRTLAFEVLQDPLWGPLVMEIATSGSLVNAVDFSLPSTVKLRGALRFEGYPEVRVENIFSGPGAPLTVQQAAIRYLSSVFALLYANRFETPRVREVAIEVEHRPERIFTVVEDLWLSRSEAAPGETVTARVFLRPYRGARLQREFQFRVPAGLSDGSLSVLVGGGQAFLRLDERQRKQRLAQSESLAQMIGVLAELPPNDGLCLRVVRRSDGGILKNRLAPGLPPSVLEVLGSSETSGDFVRLDEMVLDEQRVTLEGPVFGGRQAVLRIRS